jgi:uncharacterized protein DUF932
MMLRALAVDAIEPTAESGRWHARDVSYYSGHWDQLRALVPTFELADFRAGPDTPRNPYMRSVVRKPCAADERPVPVGVVSNTYTLVQHEEVAGKCFDGIQRAGIDVSALRCELGLTPLGEWMNLRVYFPETYRYKVRRQVGDVMDLRLECFNSVDGTSRLVVIFGWLRLVCLNGMVIGETVAERRDVHDRHLSLEPIPGLIEAGLKEVTEDIRRLEQWEVKPIPAGALEPWVDGVVAAAWGPRAACRVFHICRSGQDAEMAEPFAGDHPSTKRVIKTARVPGSTGPATTLFDAAQALSWVATERRDREERVKWQRHVPVLVDALAGRRSTPVAPKPGLSAVGRSAKVAGRRRSV